MDTSSSILASESMEPAGFWIRLGGYVIDTILLLAATFAVCIVMGFPTVMDLLASREGASTVPGVRNTVVLTLVLGVLYHAFLESSKWQATVGKKVLGLTVVQIGGARLGFGRALVRAIPKILIISLVPIAMVVIGFNARKKGIHDFIADTQVFKYDNKP